MFVALLVITPPLFPDRRDFIIYGSYMMFDQQLPSAAWSWWSWVKLDRMSQKWFEKSFHFHFHFQSCSDLLLKQAAYSFEKKNLHPQSLSGTKPSSFLFYRSVTEVLSHLSPDLCVVSCASLDLDNQAACHHTSLTLTTVCLVWTAGYGNLLDFYGSNWLSGSNMWKEEVVLSSLRG